ncbi:MAG TPA: efflux RND transporter permease subunit [Balneolaceae bacterium]|nr:efflux RND transporter permease subunit [Balneolaceae bacterium]
MIKRFIERPVLSTVMSILILLLGILGYIELPISLYPQIAPPTIRVRANYPGADAKTVLNSVVSPLEEQINGVEGMTYMTSSASNDGSADINVYFGLKTSPDIDAVNVQNRVALATPLLPQEVIQAGVTTQKQQTSRLLIFALYSTNKAYGSKFVENYARINLLPKLQRVNGVGTADAFGANSYAMRIWLKPAVMATYGLTPDDVISALNNRSFVAAPGAIGQNSGQSFEYKLTYQGRLSTVPDYKNIIIRADSANSRFLRLKDVATVKLGSQDYSSFNRINGHPGVGIFISKISNANAQQVVQNVKKVIQQSSKNFPAGIKYTTLYDANSFLSASILKVYETLIEAFILVFIVVFIFLQDWRSVLIPAAAVPVSIIGTMFFLNLFGFSLNLLTLFALLLAIGIVVDDAIIVVEIIHSKLEEGAESGMKAAVSGMNEITGAIYAISLVMSSIFIPVTFIGGSIGVFFQEFGVTLAVAILISAFNALTLSPALCALILKPEHKEHNDNSGYFHRFHLAFQSGYQLMTARYQQSLKFFSRYPWSSIVAVIAFLLIFGWLFKTTPTGFVPDEDQGAFFANVSLPASSSLERTKQVEVRIDSIMKGMKVIDNRLTIAGFGILSGSGSSYGLVVGHLKPWSQRKMSVNQVIAELQKKTAGIKEADITFFAPPVIAGFGNTNGFTVDLQDLRNGSLKELSAVSTQVQQDLMKRPEIQFAASYFRTDYPQYRVDVDAAKAQRSGITVKSILDVMQAYYGGMYISNFSRFGKLYRVYVQAGSKYRGSKNSLQNIYVKNKNGQMAPISSFVDLKRIYGPHSISRFNLYNAVEMNGAAAPGYSSGDALKAIKQVFKNKVSKNYSYAFAGLTRQENQSRGTELYIFGLCLTFVFFLLSALYESYIVPLAVILPLPVGLAGSFGFANLFGVTNNVYLQIAAIVLMGLLAKNAILIVEFALQRRRKQGMDIVTAAIKGSTARLRPILMTSFAFIAGLLPLAFATGVNSNANNSIGIGTAGGMFIGTIVGLFVVPILFVIFQNIQEAISGPPEKAQDET